jgi:non-heme chloroperoxidase
MTPYQHHVSGFFVKREEAEIARAKLVSLGIPKRQLALYTNDDADMKPPTSADSTNSLTRILVDSAVGTAVGTALGGLGEVVLAAASVTLFVASPLIAPLAMLGWGASLGAVVGAVAGAMSPSKKNGKLSELVADAIQQGQVVLVATTQSEAQTRIAIDVIQIAIGSYQDEDKLAPTEPVTSLVSLRTDDVVVGLQTGPSSRSFSMKSIITADKTELYVKDWGHGRPVILLHGWPLSSDSWDDQAMAIAQAGFRAIAYDRRGFGRSSQPWQGYDYDTLSDDLAAVIQQCGAQDATLVGFSMGGGEVARYMSRHGGSSVVQTVLVSSVVPCMLKSLSNPDGIEMSAFAEMEEALHTDLAKFFAAFFPEFFGSSLLTHPVSEPLIEWVRNIAMQASLQATLECVKSFANTDFRPDLAAFNVPTLIIHGTDDKIVPIDASGRAAAHGIRQSKLIEYAGAPHGLFVTEKDRLTRDLLAFLAQ